MAYEISMTVSYGEFGIIVALFILLIYDSIHDFLSWYRSRHSKSDEDNNSE